MDYKELVRKLRSDFKGVYAPRCLKIRTKSGKIQRFALNQAQEYIDAEIEEQRKRTGKVRKVVLKGRQQGCSTYVGGRYYFKTSGEFGKRAFILTHEAESTTALFEMTQRYHEYCPRPVKPVTGSDSSNRLEFERLGSGYRVGTAGNKAVGRGTTIQFFHGSEVAFWPNAEEHLAGVLQAVPNEPDTEVILESTANGVGGVYYDYVMDAFRGNGEFELIFVPWYWQPEYVKPVPDGFKRTEEEKLIAKQLLNHQNGSQYNWKITDAQLQWRRDKIYELKTVDKFKQEYPFTIQEAFLFSGRPVFDPNHTTKAATECFAHSYSYRVSPKNWVTHSEGELLIWDLPEPGRRYCIGCDVAEGLAHGDYSVFDILNDKGEQVAHYRAHIAPDELGKVLAYIGKRYNNALIGVERNNHGLTTLTALRDTGYKNIYHEQYVDRSAEGKETKKIGWLTSRSSKPLIIDELAARLRDGNHGIVNLATIEECQTYIIEDNGSFNAQSGCFDDRVMSYAIAIEMTKHIAAEHIYFASNTGHKPVGRAGY